MKDKASPTSADSPKGNIWAPKGAHLGPGDLAKSDLGGIEGQGRDGAQGYGKYPEDEAPKDVPPPPDAAT